MKISTRDWRNSMVGIKDDGIDEVLKQKINDLVTVPILSDKGFKLFFSNKRNTQVFLRDVLQWPELEVVKINEVKIERSKQHKNSRFDILCVDENGNLINIEMQNQKQEDLLKRSMYYLFYLGKTQVTKGSLTYENVKKTISIWIVDFKIEEHTHYHSQYEFKEKHSQHIIEEIGLHFLSLPLRKEYIAEHPEAKTEFGLDLFCLKDNRIQQKVLSELNEERKEVLLEMCHVEEEIASVYEKRGMEKGREKGIAEGIENSVRIMLDLGMGEGIVIAQLREKYGITEEEARKAYEKQTN